MSLTPAIVDALVASGVTVEQLAAAVKASLVEDEAQRAEAIAADEAKRARKRADDAERQRRHRQKGKKQPSRDVTVTPCDECDPSPKEYISNPLPDPLPPKGGSSLSVEIAKTVEAWNELAGRLELPAVKTLTGGRLRNLKGRLRENGLTAVLDALAAIERSPFWRGEATDFTGNFTSFVRPDNFANLLEGVYDSKRSPGQSAAKRDDQQRQFMMNRPVPPLPDERAP